MLLCVVLSEKEGGKKIRKVDAPYMWTGLDMLNFLRVKKLAWDSRLFSGLPTPPYPSIQDLAIAEISTQAKETADDGDSSCEKKSDASQQQDGISSCVENILPYETCESADGDVRLVSRRLPVSASSPALSGFSILSTVRESSSHGNGSSADCADNIRKRGMSSDGGVLSSILMKPVDSVGSVERQSSMSRQSSSMCDGVTMSSGGSCSTFGGGVLDSGVCKTLLLYPARSTYPVNPRIRDEMLRQVEELTERGELREEVQNLQDTCVDEE